MTPAVYVIDVETRSSVDLPTCGLRNYIDSPDFDLLVCVIQPLVNGVPGEPIEETLHTDFPSLYTILDDPTAQIAAHNAQFEYLVFCELQRRRGLQPPALSRFHCTAALARAMGLPGSLEGASQVLFKTGKTEAASKLINKFSCPPFADCEGEDWLDYVAYCRNDVALTVRLWQKLPPLTPLSRRYWLAICKMNFKGFLVDRYLIGKILADHEMEKADNDTLVADLTEGFAEKVTQVPRLKIWLSEKGINVKSLNQVSVEKLLGGDSLPAEARQVLWARLASGKATFGKYKAFLRRSDKDHRVRNDYIPFGAHPGRLSGAGSQPQNITTSKVTTVDPDTGKSYSTQKMAVMYRADQLPAAIPKDKALQGMIRGTILAPDGYDLYAVDYAAIEGRIQVWLAGMADILALYRQGEDLYIPMAAVIHRIPVNQVTKTQRNKDGKVTVLGCGYGMGAKKFAATYGKSLGEAQRCVNAYRERYSGVVVFWSAIEQAMLRCVARKEPQEYQGVCFEWVGKFVRMTPPGGRPLWYAYPKIKPGKFDNPALSFTKWDRKGNPYTKHLWGGTLLENLAQNIAGVIMSYGQLNIERLGYVASLQTHDELVVEIPKGTDTAPLDAAMLAMPAGVFTGLPLAVESQVMTRYGK